MIKLIHYAMTVMDQKYRNNLSTSDLSTYEGEATYIWLSYLTVGETLCSEPPFFFNVEGGMTKEDQIQVER